jgi:two-component system, cell cycle response regulator DivK
MPMTLQHALIIDDEPSNAMVLEQLLAEQGFSTTSLTDPRLLEHTLSSGTVYAVIFVDLEMPGLDGYAVLKRLQAAPYLQATRKVACTVHLSEIHMAHERGFDGFLGKPLDADRFPQQLARIVAGQGVWETF